MSEKAFIGYRDDELYIENLAVSALADQVSLPCYVYSQAAILEKLNAYQSALQHRQSSICYAVKANSNLSVLKLLAEQGAGFDIVSQGELERCLLAGAAADKIVFSGVGKEDAEIRRALQVGIHCFDVESVAELQRIAEIAQQQGVIAPVALRVNPNVDAKTHPYISTGLQAHKFGIAIDEAVPLFLFAHRHAHLNLKGMASHIGSQLTQIEPYLDAAKILVELCESLRLQGVELEFLNLGGGLGICYKDETPPNIGEFCRHLAALVPEHLQLILEPGRSIVAEAGLLLTKVIRLKQNTDKHFAIVDAAMNDNLRPALYNAWQEVLPVQKIATAPLRRYDVVGPVCETADFLAKDRQLAINAGDLLAIMNAGAYGFVMSSNYNSRPRCAELLVHGDSWRQIREPESPEDLWRAELPALS